MMKTQFKVYNIDGKFIGNYNLDTFQDLVQSAHLEEKCTIVVEASKVKNALLGDKGYGYCYGYFVAYRDVVILNQDQQKAFTDRWFTISYERLKKYFLECKEWDEDVFGDVFLYIYDKVMEKRGVNNIEKTFKFQYFITLAAKGRAKAKAFIFPDYDVADEDNVLVSYIQQFASESATLDELEDACLHQVNDLKKADIIKDELYSNFDKSVVDMYLDYVENFRNLRDKDERKGVEGLSIKYRIARTTVKNKIRAIKKFLKDNNKQIMNRFEDEMYPSLDSLTLKHIIND